MSLGGVYSAKRISAKAVLAVRHHLKMLVIPAGSAHASASRDMINLLISVYFAAEDLICNAMHKPQLPVPSDQAITIVGLSSVPAQTPAVKHGCLAP